MSNNVTWGRLVSLEPSYTSKNIKYNKYRGSKSGWKKCANPVKKKSKAKKYKKGKTLKAYAWTAWNDGIRYYQKTVVTNVSGLKKQKKGKGKKAYYVYWYEYKSQVYCSKYQSKGVLSSTGNKSRLYKCGEKIPPPNSFKIIYKDLQVDKEGNETQGKRNSKGTMTTTVKRPGLVTLDIQWEIITTSQVSTILYALQLQANEASPFINVVYYDPKAKANKSLKVLVSERTVEATFQGYWKGLSVTLEQW